MITTNDLRQTPIRAVSLEEEDNKISYPDFDQDLPIRKALNEK